MKTLFFDHRNDQVAVLDGRHTKYDVPAPEYISHVTHVLDADDVRGEAQRRMIWLVGARDADDLAVKISNASREAIRLLRKGAENWTLEEATRAAELEGADALIEAIRESSNAIEASPPDDYTDDKYWPQGTAGA